MARERGNVAGTAGWLSHSWQACNQWGLPGIQNSSSQPHYIISPDSFQLHRWGPQIFLTQTLSSLAFPLLGMPFSSNLSRPSSNASSSMSLCLIPQWERTPSSFVLPPLQHTPLSPSCIILTCLHPCLPTWPWVPDRKGYVWLECLSHTVPGVVSHLLLAKLRKGWQFCL